MNIEDVTHPMIVEPVYHGLDLRVPAELGNQALARLGYVDVTAAPFNADPSGVADSTKAIQAAVNFARDHQMVCFLPAGDYLVSDTIDCARGYEHKFGSIFPGRFHPCMIVGSTRSSGRARIILAPDSPGFNDPANPKHVIRFWARSSVPRIRDDREVMVKDPKIGQPNISYNQNLVSVDIEIGSGNPGAIGIYLQAAQGSGAINVKIDARHGFAGLEGGAGSGGSHFGITVIGGRVGLDLTGAQPAPTVGGITLIGQTEVSLRYSGANTLCIVGADIRPAEGAMAIQGGHKDQDSPFTGHICVIDSRIEFENLSEQPPAIETCKCLYIENSYFRNASVAVSFKGQELLRSGGNWLHVREFAKGADTLSNPKLNLMEYFFPIYVNGESIEILSNVDESEPPSDLVSRHLWEGPLPSFESDGVVSVKEDKYGARGDGRTDDSDAIQKAIDENDIVFLPKGHYVVSKTIALRPGTKIFGVSHTCSNIMIESGGAFFANANNPKAVLETPDTAEGNNVLAFFSATIPMSAAGAHSFLHQSGGSTIIACRFAYHHYSAEEEGKFFVDNERFTPPTVARGHASGKWYMHYEEQQSKGADCRQLLIEGTRQPLAFYHLNVEHANFDAQMEIRNCENVRIFGLKSERNNVVLRVTRSRNVSLYGYGGNATAFPGKSLFEIIDSQDVKLVGLSDLGLLHGLGYDHRFGVGIDPRRWVMVKVEGDSRTNGSRLCERPILFSV